MKCFFALTFSIGLLSCSTPKGLPAQQGVDVSYEEFQKMLVPSSAVLLEGQNTLLMTIAMGEDRYPSIYRYDVTSKKFTKEYDHGQTINGIGQDRTNKTIYVGIDNKGDENTGIYVYNPNQKNISPLFVKPGFKSYMLNTDESGRYLFIGSNYENKSVYSIYRMDTTTQKVERLTDGKMNLMGGLVSKSGNKVVTMRMQSNNEVHVYLIDTKSKKVTNLFKHKNSVFNPSFFSADEKTLYGDSDFNQDRMGCAQISLTQPNNVKFVASDSQKDISCAYGERSNIYIKEETSRGKSSLKLFKAMYKDEINVPELFNNQSVSVMDFDKVTNKLLLKYEAANNPGALYFMDLATSRTKLVLNYNISPIPNEQLATSYDLDYKSFDGVDIHAIVYAKPEWISSGKKFPVIVWPHGGPDSSETHNYRGVFQFLALNGFVVVAPNFRGSTGYGKKFETLNDGDWGGGHIKDVLAAKNEALKLSYVDPKNVFLLGGSFGGYSTLSMVTTYPDAFKAAVGVVAIGNLFTFMKSIPPDEAWQAEFKKEIGDPVKNKKFYEERSPFYNVSKIQIPLQIYQAENDIRTVKAEMDTFVAELRKQGKPVEYTVLKDVGHGLETPLSRKQVYEGTVKFFKTKIL